MSEGGDSGGTRRSFLRGTGATASVALIGTGATAALEEGPAVDSGVDGATEQQGGTYRRSIGPVSSLDSIEAGGEEVVRQLFDGLVRYRNATVQVTTELAATHESNTDGTVHTFTLVDARFHPPGAVGSGIDGAVDRADLLARLGADPGGGRPDPLAEFVADHGPVGTAEVAAVYDTGREEAVARLESLDGVESFDIGGERLWEPTG